MMQLEVNRLASFLEYQQHPGQLSCLTLARRGFFYNGRLLVCFRCHVPLPREENITDDNLDEVHRRLSLNCSQVETDNVPLTRPRSPETETDGMHQEKPVSATYRGALARARSRGLFSRGSETGRGNPDPGPFRDEVARLNSFRGWPQGTPVRPEDLAAAGFFYMGTGDKVCCAFCGGVLCAWKPGDDPTKEHERHYGDRNCPFPRRQKQYLRDGYCQNAAQRIYCKDQMASNLSVATTPRERPSWSEQTTLTRKESPTLQLTMLVAEQLNSGPRHPEFSDQLQRIRTYPSEAIRTGQRAESLARAGFFYEGPEDRVRCFHCAGVLKNWQPADVPLDEHKRWYPRCQFLQQLRNDVSRQDTLRPLQSSAFAAGLTAAHFNSASVYPVDSREIKARMDSASVIALMEMGFSRTLIRQAIEIRLRTTGDDFPSAESLLEAVFELQEQMSLESSASARHRGDGAPAASHLSSSTASHVITAADKKEVHPTTSANQLSNQVTQMLDASATNKSLTGKLAFEAVASTDASNTQSAKYKNKTRKKQKKTIQKKSQDNKTSEPNYEVKSNNAEGSMDATEMDLTGLEEEAESIMQENRQLKEARTCKVCLDDEVNTVFLPCGHLVCCHSCSSALKVCPMCRVLIRGTVRVFLP